MTAKNSSEFAVAHQLAALAHERYEVGISFTAPSKDDPQVIEERMMIRRWTAGDIERCIGFLKAKNLQGSHIYVRPEGEHAYSFVDDLKPAALQAMKDAGFPPALVVESSPGNYQAWVAHGETLDAKTSTAVAKALASRFGGDPSSADWRHFGRLVGFTNRKEKYRREDGKFPFVRLTECSGQLAPASPALIAQVREDMAKQAHIEVANRIAQRAAAQQKPARSGLKTIEEFRAAAVYAGDHHRADLAYATYALSRGVDRQTVADAIATRDLGHKGGAARQRDYIERTLKKAAEMAGPGR